MESDLLRKDQSLQNVQDVACYLSRYTTRPGLERCRLQTDVYWLWVSVHTKDYSSVEHLTMWHLLGLIEELTTFQNVDLEKLGDYVSHISKNIEMAMHLLASTLGSKTLMDGVILSGVLSANLPFIDNVLVYMV